MFQTTGYIEITLYSTFLRTFERRFLLWGAAGNKKPKGMHKKHAPAYQVEEAIHENDLKKGKKK